MLHWFKRKARDKEITLPVRDPPQGMWQNVWERKRQPSPGAQNYAFESLGLSPFTPSGPSVATRQPIMPLPSGPQPYVGHAVDLAGVPTTAGQVILQPLYNPGHGIGGNSPMEQNQPYPYTGQPVGGQAI